MSTREPDDADPDRTPGLEAGGGVPPGETPPDAASATEGVAHRQKATGRSAKWGWLAAIVVVGILVALLFVGLFVGLLS